MFFVKSKRIKSSDQADKPLSDENERRRKKKKDCERNMNYKKLSGVIYFAKNQNGFNNSLYDYFGHNNGGVRYSKDKIREMTQNFPVFYPCVFAIIDQTFECMRVYIDVIGVNEFNFLREIKML